VAPPGPGALLRPRRPPEDHHADLIGRCTVGADGRRTTAATTSPFAVSA
jgi:hypothetical protein